MNTSSSKTISVALGALILSFPALFISCRGSTSTESGAVAPGGSSPAEAVVSSAPAPQGTPAPAESKPLAKDVPVAVSAPAEKPAPPAQGPGAVPPEAPPAAVPTQPASPATAPAPPPAPLPAPLPAPPAAAQEKPPPAAPPVVNESVILSLKDGQVVIRLFDREAPNHCENFKRLVRSGYYSGMSIHRVCPGFVQGGDPTGTGKGGVEQTIPAEIKRPVYRGSVVAARRDDERNPKRESHGSQFFIMKVANPPFNGQYTVFGQVVRGMDLIDKIPVGNKDDDYYLSLGAGEKILKAEVVPAGPFGLPISSNPAGPAQVLPGTAPKRPVPETPANPAGTAPTPPAPAPGGPSTPVK